PCVSPFRGNETKTLTCLFDPGTDSVLDREVRGLGGDFRGPRVLRGHFDLVAMKTNLDRPTGDGDARQLALTSDAEASIGGAHQRVAGEHRERTAIAARRDRERRGTVLEQR